MDKNLKVLPGLTLGHPLGSNLDPGLAEGLEQCLWIDAKRCRRLPWERVQAVLIKLRLVVSTLCLVDNAPAGHHASSQYVAVEFLIRSLRSIIMIP